MNKKRVMIASLILSGTVMIPTVSEAKVSVSARPSVRVSTPRVSTPKVSTPRVSTSKSTSKVNTSKPINTGTKTTKVTSGNFSVKPKTSKPNTPVTTKHYNGYSNSYYPNTYSNSFFTHYALSSSIRNNDEISDRDLAKELEMQGYSQEEIKKIINEGKKETKKDTKREMKKDFPIYMLLLLVPLFALCLFAI